MDAEILVRLAGMFGPWAILALSGIGSLVVLAQVIVGLTPSTKDDEAWDKIQRIPVLGDVLRALASMAPVQKKPPL